VELLDIGLTTLNRRTDVVLLPTVGYKKRLPILTENLATVFYTVLPAAAI